MLIDFPPSRPLPLLFKWTWLVCLNTINCVFFSLIHFIFIDYDENSVRVNLALEYTAIFLAIFSFIILYAAIDFHLLKHQKLLASKALHWAVNTKAVIQFGIITELLSGLISITIIKGILGHIPFLTTFLISLFTASLLSLLTGLIWLIIYRVFLSKNPIEQIAKGPKN